MSTDNQHTPGPWSVAQISAANAHIEFPARGGSLAICFPDNGIGGKQMVANARLIAAAPELLEKLEALVEWVDPNRTIEDDFQQVSDARAAIAKARGESE